MTKEEKETLIKLIDEKIKDNNSWIKYEIDTYHHEQNDKSEQRIKNRKKQNEVLSQIKNKLQ